jgi:hypothetical protein
VAGGRVTRSRMLAAANFRREFTRAELAWTLSVHPSALAPSNSTLLDDLIAEGEIVSMGFKSSGGRPAEVFRFLRPRERADYRPDPPRRREAPPEVVAVARMPRSSKAQGGARSGRGDRRRLREFEKVAGPGWRIVGRTKHSLTLEGPGGEVRSIARHPKDHRADRNALARSRAVAV